jgi:uncharacterized protein YjbI with pentapeptide repeats
LKQRKRQGLCKLPADATVKARDDNAAQVNRITLTFVGAVVFCALSLLTPDSALLVGGEKLNAPLTGPVSFSGFMLLGPAVLIVLRVYLQIYVEHQRRLDRIAQLVPAGRLLTPDKYPFLRAFRGFTFYLLLPLMILAFWWKAAVFEWGSGFFIVAAAVIAMHLTLPFRKLPWRLRAVLSLSAAILAIAVMMSVDIPSRRFNLFRANLADQWLRSEHLEFADLNFANLNGADLRNAHLNGAHLSDAHLNGANLNGADLNGAKLDSAILSGAHLINAYLHGANLSGANLSGAILSDARLGGAHFSGGTYLDGADLRNANLSGAILDGADLNFADLRRANLNGADLSGAHLSGANLSDADLNKTKLIGADLRNANLSGAILDGADLRDADLSRADLSDADLSRADLSRANLSDAHGLTQQRLNTACGDAPQLPFPHRLSVKNCVPPKTEPAGNS